MNPFIPLLLSFSLLKDQHYQQYGKYLSNIFAMKYVCVHKHIYSHFGGSFCKTQTNGIF